MDMMETALVVDADFLMRGYAVESLKKEGIFVIEASSSEEALRRQKSQRFDLVFADLKILEEAGKDFRRDTHTVYIVMAPFSRVEKAISLVGEGVYDYLVKPFSSEQVSIVVSRTRELLALRAQIELLEAEMKQSARMSAPQQKAPEFVDFAALPAAYPPTTNLQELERQTILRVLHETCGSRGMMAKMLGISVRTLHNKLTQYESENLLQLS